MPIVNLFSQYIKKVADETDTDYADVLKSFGKSKRLQADWKAYRDKEMKSKPYLFKPPIIERIIRFENVEPITSIALPTPTDDTTLQINKDGDNALLVVEEDDGGVEETKEEDADRLFQLVQDLEINPNISRPPSTIKIPSKPDRPKGKSKEKEEMLDELEQALFPQEEEEDEREYEKLLKQILESKKKEKMLNVFDAIEEARRMIKEKKEALEGLPKRKIIKIKKPRKIRIIEEEKIEGEGFEDFLPVRRNYPPQVRDTIYWKGNEVIKKMTLARRPLDKSVFNSINFITQFATKGKFQERFKNMPYDKLFHLFLLITTTTGSFIVVEKNEVLNVALNPKITSDTEMKEITTNLPQNLTLAEMLYKTQSRMGGDKFFTYNAVRNNCQDFLLNILDANKIGDESDRQFIKQDVSGLFEGFGAVEGFISLATSLASIANRLIKGEGIEGKNYVVQTILFDKSKWDSDKANKWLRENKKKNKGVDETEKQLRYRQINPNYIEKKGFDRYATKKLGKSGISLVIAYKTDK